MRRIAGGIAVLVGLLIVAPVAPALSAQPGELDGFEYVSLGDSYSAGFGLIPFSQTSPFDAGGTTANGCYQADANYPHLVAADYSLSLTDRTCSGAVSPNLGFVAGAPLTLPPAGSLTLLPQLTLTSGAQTTMSGQTYPGLQADVLSTTTDIVTVAIGGNDLGFSDIAESCMRTSVGGGTTVLGMLLIAGYSVANCKDVYESMNPTYADFQLADRQSTYISPRIKAVFDEIAAKAPNAQVFVVGYPQIAPPDATDACFHGGFPPITDGVPFSGVDISYIHQVQSALDGALRAEAAARGFRYVDTWAASADHTICSADSWIQKLDVISAASAPDPPCPADWLPLGYHGTTYFCMKLGALHPTVDGVAMLHQLTSAAIGDVFRIAIAGNPVPGGSLTVTGGGYYPGETVDVWLHSTPRQLGTAVAGADGSFSATFALRGDDPVGAHTVIATGLSSGHAFSAAVTIEHPATGSSGAPTALLLALCLVTAGFLLVSARRLRPSGPAR